MRHDLHRLDMTVTSQLAESQLAEYQFAESQLAECLYVIGVRNRVRARDRG